MGHAARSLQLAFALPHVESFAREDFVVGPSNAAALALVDRWPDWPDNIVALSGPEGSGKSHLASVWGEKTGARFVSGNVIDDVDFQTAFSTGALVLEDIVPSQIDEVSLFHLLNFAREQKAYLLLTARTPPALWQVSLRDLSSRLRAIPVVNVTPPDDALLRALMVKWAADRQMQFDDALLSYLVPRVERSFSGARAAVTQLDREAIRQGRPVTRALAAELFRNEHA